MNKLILFFDLFRKGSAVTDPKLWKDRTALTLALTGVILAIVKVAGGLGYAIPISETEAATLAAAVAIAVGLFSNFATSDKVGLLPAKVQPGAGDDDVRPGPPTVSSPVEQHERDFPRDSGGGS